MIFLALYGLLILFFAVGKFTSQEDMRRLYDTIADHVIEIRRSSDVIRSLENVVLLPSVTPEDDSEIERRRHLGWMLMELRLRQKYGAI